MKRVAIIQSAYIPWKGFFDLLSRCDAYVIYDSAAFAKGHWHNRNKIKREQGEPWLTIPVKTATRLGQPIDEVLVVPGWAERHWDLLVDSYSKAPFFKTEAPELQKLFASVSSEPFLTKINEAFLRWSARRIGLKTEILRDRDYSFSGDKNERLVQLCTAVGATHYLSGPSAKDYLDVVLLKRAGITTEWMSYGPYPEYPQPHGGFRHDVSILDTLFCTGSEIKKFIAPIGAQNGATA